MARDRASRVGLKQAFIPRSPEDPARLEGWAAGRNTRPKLVWGLDAE